MSQVETIARAWANAWECSDSDAFVALFAPDAIYRDDVAGRITRGPDDLRAFHAHFAAALSEVKLTFRRVFQSGEDACMEWTFTGVHSGTFHGRPPTGIRFTSEGVSVLTITPDGRIRTCTDYYDGRRVAEQFGI